MGHAYTGKCIKCGFEFQVMDGGGFVFYQLRCDVCGREVSVGFDDIEEIRKALMDDSITEKEFHLKVEEHAGRCKCGGNHRFSAPARCPKCKSTEIQNTGKNEIMYD